MTRVTNFRMKRTYLEAGFDAEPKAEKPSAPTAVPEPAHIEESAESAPPKKKRKRAPKRKRETPAASEGGDSAQPEQPSATKPQKKRSKKPQKAPRQSLGEIRRLKRIQDKMADTTCFACREKGHAAKDCPTAKAEGGEQGSNSKPGVGICYRCGSNKHSLSRCKKQPNPQDPFPFASCFVCNQKGHLASACPQNADRGVYPNGGCCKLCGEKSHLAKDCAIRKRAVQDPIALVGVGRDTGADEDDFHAIRRKTRDVDHEEEQREKMRNKLGVKTGAFSGKAMPVGPAPGPGKKVVVF